MSGFQNVTGFAAPTSFAGFMALLQNAAWRGIPFKVIGASVRKGRKLALHDYPFRDGGWAEDMGRAARVYSFTGYLIGDLAPVMQLALDAAAERPGPGLLMHPTIGAVNVALLSCATAVRRDAMRVIEVQFEFVEQGERMFPATLIGTAISVVSAAGGLVSGAGVSLGVAAGAVALAPALAGGVSTVTGFASKCLSAAANPAGLVSMATGLLPELGQSFGRFANGAASLALSPGTTIASLQGSISGQIGALQGMATQAATAASQLTTTTGPSVTTALSNLTEGVRTVMTNPADQVQAMLSLAA